MRHAAPTVLLCVLTATMPVPAVAQGRVSPADLGRSRTAPVSPLAWLGEHTPRLTLRPAGSFRPGGSVERRVDARLSWPADVETPDLAVHLLASLAAGENASSRSGLRIDSNHHLGRARLSTVATVTSGMSHGSGQAVTLSLNAGFTPVWLEVRSTWLRPDRSVSFRSMGDDPFGAALPSDGLARAGHRIDAELHAARRAGPLTLRLRAGQRLDGEPSGTRRWLSGEADVPVPRASRFGLVLAGGARPDRADLGQPGGRFVELGLRLDLHAPRPASPPPAPAPPRAATGAATTVAPLAPGHYRIRLILPGARGVELKGDVTDWAVVALRRAVHDDDVWEATVHKPAGVYHINIRVDDGDWMVPPGLPVVSDRFGGVTGLLHLPSTKEADHAS